MLLLIITSLLYLYVVLLCTLHVDSTVVLDSSEGYSRLGVSTVSVGVTGGVDLHIQKGTIVLPSAPAPTQQLPQRLPEGRVQQGVQKRVDGAVHVPRPDKHLCNTTQSYMLTHVRTCSDMFLQV